MRAVAVAAISVLALAAGVWAADAAYWPKDASVYIITPRNGATVKNPITVRFGLKGVGVAPAGVNSPNTGHHHLLIDTDPPANLDLPLAKTENIRHFGKGETETTLTLPAGQHTLQLILGDMNHIPHNPPLESKKITITVE